MDFLAQQFLVTIKVPFGFKTLKISCNPLSKFSKFLTPNAMVTASKVCLQNEVLQNHLIAFQFDV